MTHEEREETLARMLEDAAIIIRDLMEHTHREEYYRELDFLEDVEEVLGKEIGG